jgi:hypothetical protein
MPLFGKLGFVTILSDTIPSRACHLDNPASPGIKEICQPYAHAPDSGW